MQAAVDCHTVVSDQMALMQPRPLSFFPSVYIIFESIKIQNKWVLVDRAECAAIVYYTVLAVQIHWFHQSEPTEGIAVGFLPPVLHLWQTSHTHRSFPLAFDVISIQQVP